MGGKEARSLKSVSTNLYLKRYAYPKELIAQSPQPDLGITVVIPCYREADLIKSLESLNSCHSTSCSAEIIVIVNHSEDELKEVARFNLKTYQVAKSWADSHSSDEKKYHILLEDQLPVKHAGVGLARKIGMDEAVRRFEKISKPGIIVCFDADCTCQPNYLKAIEKHFSEHKTITGSTIYFEHPLNGPLSPAIYKGIANYELFLRYYRRALMYSGYPYAHFTIGSCIAVRSTAYQKQGGMNRRKAGEDFYFIEEHARMGTISEITSTTVFPSPRVSTRVPFGTGKRQNEWVLSDQKEFLTFDPQIFQLLRRFLIDIDIYYEISVDQMQHRFKSYPRDLQEYLASKQAISKVEQCRKKTIEFNAFKKCFFQHFDGLWILQFLHHFQQYYKDIDISNAAQWTLEEACGITVDDTSVSNLLKVYRNIDRGLN